MLSSQIMFLRKSYGSRLNVFSPVNDLSLLSRTGFETRSMVPGKKNDVAIAGGQILGDEYSNHVVKVNFMQQHNHRYLFLLMFVEPQWHHSAGKVRKKQSCFYVFISDAIELDQYSPEVGSVAPRIVPCRARRPGCNKFPTNTQYEHLCSRPAFARSNRRGGRTDQGSSSIRSKRRLDKSAGRTCRVH